MGGQQSDQDEVERVSRQQVLLSAEIVGNGGQEKSVHRVRDLSATGIRVDRAAHINPGDTVRVSVGKVQDAIAGVVWVREGVAGLRFVEKIDMDAARAKTAISHGRSSGPVSSPRTRAGRAPISGWAGGLSAAGRRDD